MILSRKEWVLQMAFARNQGPFLVASCLRGLLRALVGYVLVKQRSNASWSLYFPRKEDEKGKVRN